MRGKNPAAHARQLSIDIFLVWRLVRGSRSARVLPRFFAPCNFCPAANSRKPQNNGDCKRHDLCLKATNLSRQTLQIATGKTRRSPIFQAGYHGLFYHYTQAITVLRETGQNARDPMKAVSALRPYNTSHTQFQPGQPPQTMRIFLQGCHDTGKKAVSTTARRHPSRPKRTARTGPPPQATGVLGFELFRSSIKPQSPAIA